MTHLLFSRLGCAMLLASLGASTWAQDAAPAAAPTGWRDIGGELRAQWAAPSANPAGPLAQAHALQPSIPLPERDTGTMQAELRGRWRFLSADVLLSHARPEGGPGESQARFNELHASADLGAWQLSAGKKVVSWDVGYAFRPNDVVQQEQRRSLISTPLEGHPLLQAEYFEAERATSLVWVQPQHLNDADEAQRGVRESALAARHYERLGGLDAYGFARVGQHTGWSLGAAGAWVATDELELHASARWLRRFDGWQPADGTNAATLARQNPWQIGTGSAARQLLIGAQWTGAWQQSLLLEAWRDTTAPSAAQWREWQTRNTTLRGMAGAGAPAAAVAGNLAWQTSPLGDGGTLGPQSLHRNNLYARLAWQPEGWQYSLDALWHPADDGLMLTAAVQWQGDAWRVNLAWRRHLGPDEALVRQLPTRSQAAVRVTRAF